MTPEALQSAFGAFFKKQYYAQLMKAAEEAKPLIVDFADLEKFDTAAADELLDSPYAAFQAIDAAISDIDVGDEPGKKITVRFRNLPESRMVEVKNLRSKHIKKLIAVEGIIKQASEVRPQITAATFECKACGEKITLLQEEQHLETPYACTCGNRRGFDLVSRKLIDHQRIVIEECPESLVGSAQPRKLAVFLRDDLVDPDFQKTVVPGSKIVVTGTLNDSPILTVLKQESVKRDIYMETNYLEPIEVEFEEIELSEKDVDAVKELAKNPEVYSMLVKSIAPSIYGYDDVKEAIALQLFGGIRKVRKDGVITRGDVHILLVGDPGAGKSQLLKYSVGLAPKARYVVGKSASGAGLCVAPDSLVLNNNGFREIKEFVEENFNQDKAVEELPNAFSNEFRRTAFALNKKLKLQESETCRIWRIKAPENMIKVTTQSGKELCLTGNTSLIRIKNGKTEWIKAKGILEKDFVACARLLPEGNTRYSPSIGLLLKNKNIRIKNDVSETFIEITDKLVRKYGSIKNIAKYISVSRDCLYLWRTKGYYHGIPLHIFVNLGLEAEMSLKELAESVKELFLRNGKNMKLPANIVDKDIAYLAGLMLGDGDVNMSRNRISMRLCGADASILKKAKEILQEKFGINVLDVNDGKRVPNIRFSHMPVYYILEAFGLCDKKEEITISHLATEMHNTVLAGLLSGLFDTDGYVSKSESSSVGISTISRNLAKNIQLSLLKFGIHSKLRERKVAGRISIGKTIFNRRIVSRHNQHYVEISGKENLELFKENIGFELERKRKSLEEIIEKIPLPNTNIDVIPEINAEVDKIIAEESGMKRKMWYLKRSNISRKKLKSIMARRRNEFLERLADSDIFWEKVVKKEEFKPSYEYVYDFSVEDHHNFVANGFFVHNTATVVKDEFMRGWALEAGALVLANNGLVCIDELDKMSTDDRSSMHEAMEQQQVTVSKANIQATLNARTTILAAANPKLGRFDSFKPLVGQIDLPETLLSRFDLIFAFRDLPNKERDTILVRHILKLHRDPEKQNPPIEGEMLRKFIAYAKKNSLPKLTGAAEEEIEKFYVGLRNKYSGEKQEGGASVPIGARQLEAIVRLSEASAKIRLSEAVTVDDAKRAIKVMMSYLTKLGVDPETGRLDIDRLESGISSTQRNKIRVIQDIIDSLARDSEDGSVLIEDLQAAAEEQGITDSFEIIQKMKREGELFEPKTGRIKKI